MEKLLFKKKEAARVRKMVSRKKLAKLEITKVQVPLSHNIENKEIGTITEALVYTAKLKAI